jgi:mitochondrial fission protein ELM1
MKKVLLLNDGKLGHFNQTKALSYALNHIVDTHTQTIHIKIKKSAKYLLRGLLNSTIGTRYLSNPNALKWIGFFYDIDEEITKCDIIISSGKDTSLLNAWLGLVYGCQTIYIGNPKKLDHNLFSTVFTVLDLGFDNQIILDVAPTRSYSGNLTEFAITYNLNPQYKYYTLLIGGDGSGYRYKEEDIEQLITFVNATADKVKWLVTTSRRTPEAYEGKMEKEMNTECFIAFHKNPQKVVAGFLELSTAVFVTEESASMVSEGVAFRKPVVTLAPKYHDADKSYQKILRKFSTEKRIHRVEISRLKDFKIDLEGFIPLKLDSCEEIAKKLKDHLSEKIL